jgi:hypothetical protein
MRHGLSRRDLVKAGTAAAALAGLPSPPAGAQDAPPLRVGLIGCGGRGTGAAEDCLRSSPNLAASM